VDRGHRLVDVAAGRLRDFSFNHRARIVDAAMAIKSMDIKPAP